MSEEKRALAAWNPKTKLGKEVKSGKIKNIDEILNSDRVILEGEITDTLLTLESDLLSIGQAKGKFGGGKRRAWRQTQKKTMEGNVVTFSCMAVVGDRKNHVGVGFGKAKETLPSRAKALRDAKLNVIKITKGFETQEEKGNLPHTVPFVVEGKCGSVRIKLLPAPRGTGLVIGSEGKKILKLAGVEDVYAVTSGQSRTTFNVAKAIIDALKKTNKEILR
jgi:small subunit ribosomal protein S5